MVAVAWTHHCSSLPYVSAVQAYHERNCLPAPLPPARSPLCFVYHERYSLPYVLRAQQPYPPPPAFLPPPTLSAVQAYHVRNSLPAPSTLLDIGCSTGISTRWYQKAFPHADLTGLDLSPYFLAVAELEERWVVGCDRANDRGVCGGCVCVFWGGKTYVWVCVCVGGGGRSPGRAL
jgi:SAM-dependent methyltransferase